MSLASDPISSKIYVKMKLKFNSSMATITQIIDSENAFVPQIKELVQR